MVERVVIVTRLDALHWGACAVMIVVFDLDGTLIDSKQALLEAHDMAWSSNGLARPSNEAILDLIGLPLIETMQRLAPDQDPVPLAKAYSESYSAVAERYEVLFEGMATLLAQPFRAAVATGKSQRGAERAVARHGLTGRFEVVFGGDAVPRPKPFPDMLEAIRTATGEHDLVMIGDTVYDLEMAHAAGAYAIGVSWGHHTAERLTHLAPVVHSVDALGVALQQYDIVSSYAT